jgi:hypothetical protein
LVERLSGWRIAESFLVDCGRVLRSYLLSQVDCVLCLQNPFLWTVPSIQPVSARATKRGNFRCSTNLEDLFDVYVPVFRNSHKQSKMLVQAQAFR